MLYPSKARQNFDGISIKMLRVLKLFNRQQNCFFNHYFLSLLSVLIFGYSLPTMASEEKSNVGNELELLQTEITQNDPLITFT
ncbi:hypothetical protein H6G06_07740 [Anabaena sphaerica FACHB-251]|uniref:Uncharacterized protein n=1 Tax=Anabaena sphaerica FACHB-251 TaxID=2692883 RepID=A0A926WFB3_9NOST|nr:hypothetical protein [Anabaena sphaerica]MBD2293382.1 hypothetical protein [Anabaena sphaerica FACHB-251]